jgi:hypothetical protein
MSSLTLRLPRKVFIATQLVSSCKVGAGVKGAGHTLSDSDCCICKHH